MMRRLGVLVALCALAGTASADKAKKAPTPTKKAPAAPAATDDQPPADDGVDAQDDGSVGSDAGAQELPRITGPQHVDLGHDTEIDLPAGMILFEHDAAKRIAEESGDNGDDALALIAPSDKTQTWYISVDYSDDGYVSDKDADELDANDLMKSYQEGTAQQNERRRSLGVPELFVDGWSENPRYEKASHQLIWGLNVHDTNGPAINSFTRVLGRTGYMSVNLVDAPEKIEQSKIAAAAALQNIRFKTGFKYEDYKSGDKDSGMGLKALIVGGAGIAVFKAAKGGWIIAALVAMKKAIILVVAGIAAFFKKIFGRGKKVELPPDGPPPGDPNVG
jgi:uncharacterized membrane-anchored protein